jgi:hypothetical protein
MAGARAKIGTQRRFNFAAMIHKKRNATVKPFNSDGSRWGAIAQLCGSLFDQQGVERGANACIRSCGGDGHR